MPCISPDGKPTETGIKMLKALQGGIGAPEAVAQTTGLPLFRVRSGLRELAQAGMVEPKNGDYVIASRGAELIGE